MRFYQTTTLLKWLYPSLIWEMDSEDTIYLTFDDGPTKEVTPWVLDELNKVDGKATFFCLGKNLKENREIAKEMSDQGHALGNHTFDHLNGWRVSSKDYDKNIKRCDEELGELNVSTRLFRPPYGRVTPRQIRKLDQKEIIMWSYMAWDFSDFFKTKEVLKSLKDVKAGDIVLFHDTQKAFTNLKKVLPELLNDYKSKGLKFGVLQ